MLKMSKSFVVRMVIWSVLIVYILCDFLIFSGPLKREARRMFPSDADKIRSAVERGICARVYNEPIYVGQVQRRVEENLWRAGRDVEKIGLEEMRMLRWAALDDLIVEHILRIKVRVNREEVSVSEQEIDTEVLRFEKRFTSSDELDKALAAQGIESREELRFRLAAGIQQDKYVQIKIAGAIKVTDQEARAWYGAHQEDLMMPERRRVRHVFLATLDHSSDEVEGELKVKLRLILEGEREFSKVAAELSEDERSRQHGGDLGWMRRGRLPEDFGAAVFSLPLNQPTLVRTKIGWHIVEVTGIKAPGMPAYDKVKQEIMVALSDEKRKEAVAQYRHQLKLLSHQKVEIYKVALDGGE